MASKKQSANVAEVKGRTSSSAGATRPAEYKTRFPGLADFKWRTDVTISTTAMSRVFQPTVVMQMTLSDGSIKQFECSKEKFEELRLNVALCLKNMQILDKRVARIEELSTHS